MNQKTLERIGVNTIGASLGTRSRDIVINLSDPKGYPRINISPWMVSTIDPDNQEEKKLNKKLLEIPYGKYG